MHYNYEIHYRPGDKNCATDALSQHAKLRPPDGEDEQPTVLIPPEKFTELAACEVDLTQTDWEGLMVIFAAALLISDADIMSEACTLSVEWPDKPEELVCKDRLG